MSDGRIVVLDQGSSQVRFYDSAGTFLGASGSRGDGPGEFRNAFGLWVTRGDTLWAGDYGAWQFEVFSPHGEWVRDVRPATYFPASPDIAVVLENGLSILGDFKSRWIRTSTYRPAQIDLVLHDEEGALVDTIATLDYGMWRLATPSFAFHRLFESFPMASGSGRRLALGHGGVPEVQLFEAAGEGLALRRVIRFETPEREVTDADIALERKRVLAEYFELEGQGDAIPSADMVPAFTSLRVGRDGWIWIREHGRNVDEAPEMWLGFTPEGTIDCRLEMIESRQVFELNAGYALVLREDELGVERVERYGIVRPGR